MMAKTIKTQVPIPEQPVEKRVKNFDEVPLGYTKEQVAGLKNEGVI